MSDRARVLVVDDDDDIRGLLRDLLTRAGYDVAEVPDGRAALRLLLEEPPELVILDVTMPGIDGYATLERIRDLSDVPVLMLTARTQELERVRGWTTGANDYLAKPFGRQELLASVQALVRRAPVAEAYEDELVAIDFGRRRVTSHGRDIQLTPLEFKLLSAFVHNPGRVLTHDQLVELVWGDPQTVSSDQVELYVESLRAKLVPDSPEQAPLESVAGSGYRYRVEQARDERSGGSGPTQEFLLSSPDRRGPG
jgi:DNA-binding response OmpR family regulator